MEKAQSNKLKILFLMKILLEQTDNDHSLTMSEIIGKLDECGVSAERKSIYTDLDTLREYGLNVEVKRDKSVSYYVANRTFELPELKLLVDAVQSSRFITGKKSNELISKISSFASVYEAMQLRRQVYVANRIKTKNESIYYNIDAIHTAILRNCRITFQYYDWTPEKTKKLRHDGSRYEVSPWALTWDDENYYLIAYDSAVCDIRHFRVDKMLKIDLTDLRRDGKEKFDDFDMAIYSKQVFGMFGGRPETVTLLCENSLAGVIIDRFGEDVTILSTKNSDSFTVSVRVVVSPMFLSWVASFGGRIKITAPDSVKDDYKKLLLSALGEE